MEEEGVPWRRRPGLGGQVAEEGPAGAAEARGQSAPPGRAARAGAGGPMRAQPEATV